MSNPNRNGPSDAKRKHAPVAIQSTLAPASCERLVSPEGIIPARKSCASLDTMVIRQPYWKNPDRAGIDIGHVTPHTSSPHTLLYPHLLTHNSLKQGKKTFPGLQEPASGKL